MKKTLSVILSFCLIFSLVFGSGGFAFAEECEHDYVLSYTFDKDSNTIIGTPACRKCGNVDSANIIVFKDITFDGSNLTVEVNDASNPYLSKVPIYEYFNGTRFYIKESQLLDAIKKLNDSLTQEDKKNVALALGLDEKIFTCNHTALWKIESYSITLTDVNKGKAVFVCPDCGLRFELNFEVEEIDFEDGIITIKIIEFNKSFRFDIADFLKQIKVDPSSPELAQYVAAMKMYSKQSTKKPKATKIKKLIPAKKAVTVKWKKVSGVTGYQIKYSTTKKFSKKTMKTINIKGAKKVKRKIKKLKKKKKYYFKIRTYKTQNKKKTYSKWSKVKSVKTK